MKLHLLVLGLAAGLSVFLLRPVVFMNQGQAAGSDVRIESGHVLMALGVATTNIALPVPYVGTNYAIYFDHNGLNTTPAYSAVTKSNFTMTLTPPLAGTVRWMTVYE